MEPRIQEIYIRIHGTKDTRNVYKDTMEPRKERMYIRMKPRIEHFEPLNNICYGYHENIG